MTGAMQNALRRQLMRGLLRPLSPLELAMLLGDLYFGQNEPVTIPFDYGLGPGWTRCSSPTPACEATWGPPTHYKRAGEGAIVGCDPFGSCPTNQAIGPDGGVGAITILSGTAEVWWMKRRGTLNRYDIFRRDYRPVPGPVIQTKVRPSYTRMPEVAMPPLPVTKEKTETRTRTRPAPAPFEVPSVVFTPRNPGGVKTPVATVPPPRGTREKKGLILTGGPVGKAYGLLTEFGDMLDCMIKNTKNPDPARRRRPRPGAGLHEKAAWVAANAGDLDMPGFIGCMLAENFKDAVIGKANRAASKAATGSPYWVRPVGPGAGGWAARNAMVRM